LEKKLWRVAGNIPESVSLMVAIFMIWFGGEGNPSNRRNFQRRGVGAAVDSDGHKRMIGQTKKAPATTGA
jgi:hypothetical protein